MAIRSAWSKYNFGGITIIKATIGNGSFDTEICFPCSETKLPNKLGELGMDKEHLSPAATVLEIKPSEVSMLVDCEVSLDALNYLGKRMDEKERQELNEFSSVLSSDCIEITDRVF